MKHSLGPAFLLPSSVATNRRHCEWEEIFNFHYEGMTVGVTILSFFGRSPLRRGEGPGVRSCHCEAFTCPISKLLKRANPLLGMEKAEAISYLSVTIQLVLPLSSSITIPGSLLNL